MSDDQTASYDDIVTFARYMYEIKDWEAEDILNYLDKPWRWTAERNQWKAATGGRLKRNPATIGEPNA